MVTGGMWRKMIASRPQREELQEALWREAYRAPWGLSGYVKPGKSRAAFWNE